MRNYNIQFLCTVPKISPPTVNIAFTEAKVRFKTSPKNEVTVITRNI